MENCYYGVFIENVLNEAIFQFEDFECRGCNGKIGSCLLFREADIEINNSRFIGNAGGLSVIEGITDLKIHNFVVKNTSFGDNYGVQYVFHVQNASFMLITIHFYDNSFANALFSILYSNLTVNNSLFLNKISASPFNKYFIYAVATHITLTPLFLLISMRNAYFPRQAL